MDNKPYLDRLSELLRLPRRWMIMDKEGNYHELNSGVKGTTVLGSSKKDIYNLCFGKEDITEVHMILLDEIHSELMQFIWDNFSDDIKEENREILKPLIKKYQLEGPAG
ncbi:MAG: hypothetical protein R6U58_07820 [Bacteroidales bacterium]